MAPKTEWTQAHFLNHEAVKLEHRQAMNQKGINHRPQMHVLCGAPWRTAAIVSNHSLLKWVTDPACRQETGSTPASGEEGSVAVSTALSKSIPGHSFPKPSQWTVILFRSFYLYSA